MPRVEPLPVGRGKRCSSSTTDAPQFFNNLTGLHATHEDGYALKISMASTHELNIADNALVIYFKIYLGRASPMSIIGVTHLE